MNDRHVLTLFETADWLQVYFSTVYRLVKRDDIKAFRMGSDWRFNVEDLLLIANRNDAILSDKS